MRHNLRMGVPLDIYPLNPPYSKGCVCHRCLSEDYDEREKAGTLETPFSHPIMMMVLCQKCGHKRCPHATDHNFACTNSNAPKQAGSRYQ